jgi:hypothetical protein
MSPFVYQLRLYFAILRFERMLMCEGIAMAHVDHLLLTMCAMVSMAYEVVIILLVRIDFQEPRCHRNNNVIIDHLLRGVFAV